MAGERQGRKRVKSTVLEVGWGALLFLKDQAKGEVTLVTSRRVNPTSACLLTLRGPSNTYQPAMAFTGGETELASGPRVYPIWDKSLSASGEKE